MKRFLSFRSVLCLASLAACLSAGAAVSSRPAAKQVETQTNVIDILLAYDNSAVNWLSRTGRGSVEQAAAESINRLNEILLNSQISEFHFRLAGTVVVDVDATTFRNEQGEVDPAQILRQNLINDYGKVIAKGEWLKVSQKRDEVGADLVAMVVDIGEFGCVGWGYTLENLKGLEHDRMLQAIPDFAPWAYCVCSVETLDSVYTLAHEVGHFMGCGHPDCTCADDHQIALGPQLFPYSSGYYFWEGDTGYATVMGYNYGGLHSDGHVDPHDYFTVLPYFSSPLLTHDGYRLGTEHNDNRRTLLETYPYVARFRVAKLPPERNPALGPLRVEGEFRPTKALNAVAPYVGCVYDGETPIGILQLKCGKPNARTGLSKVSATVIGLDGKKKTAKAVDVACGFDAEARGLFVKDWGELSLVLGGEGFVGTLGSYTVRTAQLSVPATCNRLVFSLRDFAFAVPDAGYDVLEDYLPADEAFSIVKGKWSFAPAPTLRYKKEKTSEGPVYQLVGADDPKKPNVSGLKLTYTAKTGLFKGSFKVYASNAAVTAPGKAPKLKKYTITVTGFLSGTAGGGQATCKKPAGIWKVEIHE